MSVIRIDGEPMPIEVELAATALLVIDMQKDFLCRGGFGEFLGNDPDLLHRTVAPIARLLAAARQVGMTIIHTARAICPI